MWIEHCVVLLQCNVQYMSQLHCWFEHLVIDCDLLQNLHRVGPMLWAINPPPKHLEPSKDTGGEASSEASEATGDTSSSPDGDKGSQVDGTQWGGTQGTTATAGTDHPAAVCTVLCFRCRRGVLRPKPHQGRARSRLVFFKIFAMVKNGTLDTIVFSVMWTGGREGPIHCLF